MMSVHGAAFSAADHAHMAEALRLAAEFWPHRFRMQGKLIPLERAVAAFDGDADEGGHDTLRRRLHVGRTIGAGATTSCR